jgi:hypothetical protein
MIVELCGADLLDLVNGKQVVVEDIIFRQTDADTSNVTGAIEAVTPNRRESGNRRHVKPRGPRKTGAHVINSRFRENRCADCTATWGEGEKMIYDYDARKPYCLSHGVERFPQLASEVQA